MKMSELTQQAIEVIDVEAPKLRRPHRKRTFQLSGPGRMLPWFVALLAGSGLSLIWLSSDQRHVAAPAVVLFDITALFVLQIWRTDKVFPLYELGTFTVA